MSSIFFRTLALMSVLLCGVSADAAISLDCNETENVTSGDDRNLTCFFELKQNDCKDVYVEWSDTVGDLCVNNRCISNYETFATLQMLNVTENKTITVEVGAVCGKDFKTVSVKVYPDGTAETPAANKSFSEQQGKDKTIQPGNDKTIQPGNDKTIAIALAAVSAVVIVVVGVWHRSKRVSPAGEALTGPIKTENDFV